MGLSMGRSWVRRILPSVALSVLATACGSSPSEPSATSAVSTSGPATVWFAVLSSSADPNALDDDRAAIVDALGESFAANVVVSQGACFTGLPARYGSGYVLAVWDDDEDAVHGDLDDAGSQAAWIGQVTSTCVD
jgi:hypothetical protein